jgi:hypothetical protein
MPGNEPLLRILHHLVLPGATWLGAECPPPRRGAPDSGSRGLRLPQIQYRWLPHRSLQQVPRPGPIRPSLPAEVLPHSRPMMGASRDLRRNRGRTRPRRSPFPCSTDDGRSGLNDVPADGDGFEPLPRADIVALRPAISDIRDPSFLRFTEAPGKPSEGSPLPDREASRFARRIVDNS